MIENRGSADAARAVLAAVDKKGVVDDDDDDAAAADSINGRRKAMAAGLLRWITEAAIRRPTRSGAFYIGEKRAKEPQPEVGGLTHRVPRLGCFGPSANST